MLRRQFTLHRASAVAVMLALFGHAACSGGEADPPLQPRGAQQQQPGTVVTSDDEIAAIVRAINDGEIAHAQIALTRAQLPAVRDFASYMLNVHRQANANQGAHFQRIGVLPRQNVVSETVASEAAAFSAELNAISPDLFDRRYMEVQVTMHGRALDLLDTQLIPVAQHLELRAALDKARTEVAAHLEEARQILSSLSR